LRVAAIAASAFDAKAALSFVAASTAALACAEAFWIF
jgi:hypothetical protein